MSSSKKKKQAGFCIQIIYENTKSFKDLGVLTDLKLYLHHHGDGIFPQALTLLD